MHEPDPSGKITVPLGLRHVKPHPALPAESVVAELTIDLDGLNQLLAKALRGRRGVTKLGGGLFTVRATRIPPGG